MSSSEANVSCTSIETDTRNTMKTYWSEDHGAPTIENMMLDSNAAMMDLLEKPEILSELPSLTGMDVLELGAGIGRYTTPLAERAESVTAVDFVEASCNQNRMTNKNFCNVTVLCEDATKLDFSEDSFDLVFSNWLLMYLNDKEVQKLAKRTLGWLKPGGKLFFRESCFHVSGNASRSFNPTHYRHPNDYFRMFHECRIQNGCRFQLAKTSCVDTYVRMKSNQNQLWWIWQKCSPIRSHRIEDFLDRQQYDFRNVLRYEKLYGRGFISTGGDEIIRKNMVHLNIKPFMRVLDVGCGVGGSAIFLASQMGCFVHAIDLSGVMISMLANRVRELDGATRNRISFAVGDVFEVEFVQNSFDLVICRDMILHLSHMDKRILLAKLGKWLSPGGMVFITDYTSETGESRRTDEFKKYVAERNYYLLSLSSEIEVVKDMFEVTKYDDETEFFKSELEHNLSRYRSAYYSTKTPRNVLSRVDPEALFDTVLRALNSSSGLRSVLGCTDHSDEKEKLLDEVLRTAAQGAVVSVKTLMSVDEAERAIAEADMEWVDKYWSLKIEATVRQELGWCVIIARRN